MPKVIQVIEAEENDGNGKDNNPYRIVRRYYTLEGELLAEYDSWKERPAYQLGLEDKAND